MSWRACLTFVNVSSSNGVAHRSTYGGPGRSPAVGSPETTTAMPSTPTRDRNRFLELVMMAGFGCGSRIEAER